MSEEIVDRPESSQEPGKSVVDDARFEVKWKKKETSSQPRPPSEDAPAADEVQALRGQLEEAQKQISDLRDRWQRSAADLANLRRHTEQQRGEMEQFASMLLVMDLLPVLDNFERAIATIPGNLALLTWIQGVLLIERHLRAILESRGVAEIDADGKAFDPHRHEAISERETADVPAGQVVAVLQKGYTMHGRVIRPALVEVSRAPQPGAEPAASGEQTTTREDAESIAADAQAENPGP
jgi:molecular chaperone GrpE